MIIAEFLESCKSTIELKKNGNSKARFPWKKREYRDVNYSNQSAKIDGAYLILPNGYDDKRGKFYRRLKVRLPKKFKTVGRLMEARLKYGEVILTFQIQDEKKLTERTLGVDLGVNTLIAVTDGEKSLLISGREVKAINQYRNQKLASIQSKISQKEKHSRRWKKLTRRKHRMLTRSKNKIKDILHKATRKVADFFPNSKVYVGESFNEAAQKLNHKTAQQVSEACNSKIIWMLDYKTSGAIQVSEAYSSQTCPVCGCRNKCRRQYVCKGCGFKAPRDLVGALNIRTIGMKGKLEPGSSLPKFRWSHPIKYSRTKSVLDSSSGSLGNSSNDSIREACG